MLVHSVRHQDLQEAKEVPNIQSAKKRVKVSETKNLRNRMVKSGVKTSPIIPSSVDLSPLSSFSKRPSSQYRSLPKMF